MKRIKLIELYENKITTLGLGKILSKIDGDEFIKILKNFNNNVSDIKSFISTLNIKSKHVFKFNKRIYGIELLGSPDLLINISLIYRFFCINHSAWLQRKKTKEKWYKNKELIDFWEKITNSAVILSLEINDYYMSWDELVDSPISGLSNNINLDEINRKWSNVNYYKMDEIEEIIDLINDIEILVDFIDLDNKDFFKIISKKYKLLEFKNCFLYLKENYIQNSEILKIVHLLEDIYKQYDINFFFSFISKDFNWNYTSKNEENLSRDLLNWFDNFVNIKNIQFIYKKINDQIYFYNLVKIKSLNQSFLFNSYILDTCYYVYHDILRNFIEEDIEKFNMIVNMLFIFDLYITFDNENNFKLIKRFKTAIEDEFMEFINDMKNSAMIQKTFNELLFKLFNSDAYSNLEIKMRTKEILFIYENILSLKNSKTSTKIKKENINIEHLLPKNDPKNNYKINKYMKGRVVNHIGNLFLIDKEINKKLANQSFENKKNILKENADLSIKEILVLEKWNDTNIKNRSENIWNTIFNYIQADLIISTNSVLGQKKLK